MVEVQGTAMPRTYPWAYLAIGLVALGSGGAWLASAVSLPYCDTSTTIETLDKLLNAKATARTTADHETITADHAEKACRASVRTEGNVTAIVEYRIYWSGWSKLVQVTAVEASPPQQASSPKIDSKAPGKHFDRP